MGGEEEVILLALALDLSESCLFRACVGFRLLASSFPTSQTEFGKGRPNVGLGFAGQPSLLT